MNAAYKSKTQKSKGGLRIIDQVVQSSMTYPLVHLCITCPDAVHIVNDQVEGVNSQST